MNAKSTVGALVLVLSGAACATTPRVPNTLGDARNAQAYGYTPLDPIPVQVEGNPAQADLLKALPNETVRIAIGEVGAKGGLTFGTAKLGAEGRSYEVILDYIKFTTKSFGANIKEADGIRTATLVDTTQTQEIVPVYAGVGLRLTASVHIRKGSVDLGNLFAIGAAAEANQLTGTLVVQSLGISGAEVSPLIPMPGKIDDTTIQNAILALGAIKAKLYDNGTDITPAVVAVYNTLGGGQETINNFISHLFERPLVWNVQKREVRR